MICRHLLHDKIKKHTAMKKLFLSLLLALAALPIAAQEPASPTVPAAAEPPFENTLVLSDNAAYRLYPTRNISTFIKLDTRTGQMWQLQYTVDEEKGRFEYDLNPQPLLLAGMQPVDGRYELYPTKNMYNFILIDQIEGVTWQVQWSLDDDKRMVLPISR